LSPNICREDQFILHRTGPGKIEKTQKKVQTQKPASNKTLIEDVWHLKNVGGLRKLKREKRPVASCMVREKEREVVALGIESNQGNGTHRQCPKDHREERSYPDRNDFLVKKKRLRGRKRESHHPREKRRHNIF